MKKTSWILILLSFFCLVIFNTNKVDAVSFADNSSVVQFEISNGTSDKISVKSNSPVVSSEFSKFSDVLDVVISSTTKNTVVYLNFVNFDLDKTTENSLVFNRGNTFVLTGNISSTKGFAGIVISGEDSTNLSLSNLSLNISNSVNVIEFENSGHILNILSGVTYSNSNLQGMPYLFEYKKGNTIELDENNQSKIKALIPYYDLCNENILSCNIEESVLVELFTPENSYFKLYYFYSSISKTIVVNTEIFYRFDLNSGEYEKINVGTYSINDEDYIIPYPYFVDSFEVLFNEQGDAVKDFSTFLGWFGKVKIDEIDYYFDTNMLSNYLNSSDNISNLANYLTTDINELDNSSAILGYCDKDKNDLKFYAHMSFFLENGFEPTYIAKWKFNEYTISFETNCDEEIDDITIVYGENIPEFEEISKEGYVLEGWYTDSQFENKFTETTMVGNDITLYAKWEITTFVITYESNGGSSVAPQTYEYNSQIVAPIPPTRAGYSFEGWYIDEELQNIFIFDKMCSSNITLYAKWIEELYSITIISSVSYTSFSVSEIPYNSNIPHLVELPETGFEFVGWYTNTNFNVEFDLTQKVVSDLIIYAYYIPIEYTLTFVTNCEATISNITQYYQTSLEIPEIKNAGFAFAGWFTEEGLVNQFDSNTMPASNFTLYAKWIEKQTINININSQSYVYDKVYAYFQGLEDIQNIKIHYLVGENWVVNPPQEIGEYDVRITRNEDDTYKAVDIIIEKGLKVLTPVTSVAWIIVFFYLATLAEMAVAMFVRMMRKKKLSATYVFIGSIFIKTSQFVHLIISGLIFLAGFVYMVYQIVQVGRTVNNENFAPSKQDNRERFKEALAFQNDKNNAELDFETKTKTDESFGEKYSESDIEKMLEGDTYRDELNKSREKFGGLVDSRLEDDNYYGNYDWDDDYNEDLVHENVMPNKLRKNEDLNERESNETLENFENEDIEKLNTDEDDGI